MTVSSFGADISLSDRLVMRGGDVDTSCCASAIVYAIILSMVYTSDRLHPDGCKLCVLYTFHINSTPIWRLDYFASRESSIDYTALRI